MQLRNFFRVALYVICYFSILAPWCPRPLAAEYDSGDLNDGAVYETGHSTAIAISQDASLKAGHTAAAVGTIELENGASLTIHGKFSQTLKRNSTASIKGFGNVAIEAGGSFTLAEPNRDLHIQGSWTDKSTMTINNGATAHAGRGVNISHNGELISNGNLHATDVTIQAGGRHLEKVLITIDQKGGSATTRDFITSYPGYWSADGRDKIFIAGGIYEGDVIVDYERPDNWKDEGGLIIGGTHIGNVTLKRGVVEFWRGGTLQGDLTVGAGTVHLTLSEGDGPPAGIPGAVSGRINIIGGDFIVDPQVDFSIQNDLSICGGNLDASEATLISEKNISITNGASADIGTLSNFNNTLMIGSERDTQGGAGLVATNLELGANGKLIMDPPWGLEPSNAAIENFVPAVNGKVVLAGQIGVGMNSSLAVGTREPDWLPDMVKEATGGAGLSANGVKSAFGLYKPLQIATGSKLMVDGSKTSAQITAALDAASPNTATFANKSLLVLNGKDPDMKAAKAAIDFEDKDGSVAVHNGAQVFISQAQPGKVYKIVDTSAHPIQYYSEDGKTTINKSISTAWKGKNLLASSDMINLTYKDDGTIVAASDDSQIVYPDLSPGSGGAVDEIYTPQPEVPDKPATKPEPVNPVIDSETSGQPATDTEAPETPGVDVETPDPSAEQPATEDQPDEKPETPGQESASAATIPADPNSPLGGVRFLSRATDNEWNGGASARQTASVIESAARMAIIGAVPQMAFAANDAAANAVNNRFGIARSGMGALSENYNSGLGLWIMPLYQSVNGFGMEAGNLDHDFSGALGGVALGADWSFSNHLRVGLAFDIGGGYAKGSGDMQDTENHMSFWGLEAYAGWRPGDFGLFADFGLTSTYNRLKQELPGFMGMNDLKSDVEAIVLSGGLRAEYTFHAGALEITPHAGARYHYLRADSHDIKSGGLTMVKADSFDQNIWTFPLGVSFNSEAELSNGWNLRPSLDLAITPAVGDIKAKTKARFTGTSHKADLSTQTRDWTTYGGTAGLELAKDNLSLSVFYSGQFGPHSSAHGVNAAFRYEF